MASVQEREWGIRSYSKFTGSGTELDPYVRAVDVDSSVLPTGAATESKQDDELVLKQDTTYLRSFLSGADNNIIQFKASWYEHENK